MKASIGSYFMEDSTKLFYQVLQASGDAVTVARVEIRSYMPDDSLKVLHEPVRDAFAGEPFERAVVCLGDEPYSEYIELSDGRRAYFVGDGRSFDF